MEPEKNKSDPETKIQINYGNVTHGPGLPEIPQEPMPQVPRPNLEIKQAFLKKWKLFWVLLIIAVVIVPVGGLVYYKVGNKHIKTNPTGNVGQKPTQSNQASSAPVILPDELKTFILPGAEDVSFADLTFQGGSHGYLIKYQEPQSQQDLLNKFVNSGTSVKLGNKAGYKLSYTTKIQQSDVVSEQGPGYKVKITISFLSASSSQLTIVANKTTSTSKNE